MVVINLDSSLCSLTSRGFGIPKEILKRSELEELKKELTVQPQVGGQSAPVGGGQPQTFRLYLESSKKLYVPKYFGLSKWGVPGSIKLNEGADIEARFTGSLRDEQKQPIDAFLKACNDPAKMGGIISLSCGGGKTVLGLYAVAALRKKAMIIVHKDFLLAQWRERIQQFLPEARVGLIKAKVVDVADKDIVIASLQSLSMKEYDPRIFEDIGFVVIDEVHRTGTEVFSSALHKVNFKYALGLSATVQRKDGMTKVFKWFLGDIVYKKKRDSDNVIVKKCEFYSPDEAYSKEETIFNGKLNLSKMINNVCDFFPRTEYIVQLIARAMAESNQSRKVLVLSDRKAHLSAIKELIECVHPSISCGFYIGGMKEKDLKISETKDVILATFSFASEGFDAKDLDTLVLGSPKTDIEQSVGRILRQKENERKNVPIIFDIMDMFSIFERQAKKRLTYYKKLKYTIKNDAESDDESSDHPEENIECEDDGEKKKKPSKKNTQTSNVCMIVDDDY